MPLVASSIPIVASESEQVAASESKQFCPLLVASSIVADASAWLIGLLELSITVKHYEHYQSSSILHHHDITINQPLLLIN